MKQHSDDVMLERPRVETKRHRRGRRFVMVVAAVGLLACGVLGGIVASRYLDGGPRVPVASSPPCSVTVSTVVGYWPLAARCGPSAAATVKAH